MDQFFTWQMLATLAGCTTAVGIFTQFLKDAFDRLPTQWLSYALAVVVLGLATLFTGGADAGTWALIPFNAVIVSTSANGAYAALLRAKKSE